MLSSVLARGLPDVLRAFDHILRNAMNRRSARTQAHEALAVVYEELESSSRSKS